MKPDYRSTILVILALGLLAAPASAQMRRPGWGGPADPFGYDRFPSRDRESRSAEREGKIEVERFAKEDALDLLGSGPVAVEARVSGMGQSRAGAPYESAVVDQLVQLGYDTLDTANAAQRVEMQILREVAEPAEPKRSPVSGETTIGISNRGSYYGFGLNLDFTKPRTALLSTRMNLRIVDVESGEVIWEGHATLYSRDGDEDYDENGIAWRLASTLFAEFPAGPEVTLVS